MASVVFVLPSTLALSRLSDSEAPLVFSLERALVASVAPPELPPRTVLS
jgi:hypothetical protein